MGQDSQGRTKWVKKNNENYFYGGSELELLKPRLIHYVSGTPGYTWHHDHSGVLESLELNG